MNILFYRYGSICEPDYITGFKSLGFSVSEITAEITDKELKPDQVTKLVSDELFKGGYDCVFTINFYPVISSVCNVFKVRYVCHTVDSPVHELYAEQLANPWNRVFLFDMDQFRMFSDVNPGRVFHLPLATNPERWDAVIDSASDEDVRRFSSDISFVGSLYTEKNPYTDYEGKDDYVTGFVEGAMRAQLKVYGYHFLDEIIDENLVQDFKHGVKDFYTPAEAYHMSDKDVMIRHYLDAQITVMERREIMKCLGEAYDVDLYTASDTRGLPVNDKGTCKTLTEMPLIFRYSKININPTTKGIREGLPLRIFDVLGCGGFLITNYQAELPEYFTPGEDIAVYESMDDLVDKVGYYLKHDDERMQIAGNGHRKVCEYHNYKERILTMLETAFGV